MSILTVAGIPIRLHSSFLLLGGALVAWEAATAGGAAAFSALVYGLLLFGSVLVHELGHALTGRWFGVQTKDITLYPFGGVARMAMARLSPGAEAAIALAGPLTNVLIALGAGLLVWAGWSSAMSLLVINIALAVFNLVPAWPMDGGRVLRSVLSIVLGEARSGELALGFSRLLAWAMVLGGAYYSLWSLALVGAFLLLMIRAERTRLRHQAVDAPQGPSRWSEPEDEQRARLSFPHPTR